MTGTYEQILRLVKRNDVMISDHGYDELAEDNIFVREVLDSVFEGIVLEDYPQYVKGACVLVLQKDTYGKPMHVVWGIPKGKNSPAVLVTAYRPNPIRWSEDFTRRKHE